ncbi:hypothetical protein [Wolbachia endosymbiont of Ctenocephalides felis wCfeJ]|nr:hypothetical protein [Wolbachia endosymbiont of Ctenocephalides felis wCfeJ]
MKKRVDPSIKYWDDRKKTTWMTSLGHSGDIHNPVITTCNS